MKDNILKDYSAAYYPGFMQIKLTHLFKNGFKDFTTEQIGVFLHEYIHYLQNISTPWGLYSSMVQYQTLSKTYAYIQANTDTIKLPLKLDKPELQRRWDILKIGSGTYPFNNEYDLTCQVIDRSKPIGIHRSGEKIGNKICPKISLDITFTDGTSRTIYLGASIINESMAAMYQMLIDPNSTHEKHDFPYNLIPILAEQKYPNIADDRRKLIVLCYISLFSMTPAETLFYQMDNASENPDISGPELFENFLKNSKITDNRGKENKIIDFMDELIDRFKSILSITLGCELDYIAYVLDKVRISQNLIPLVNILYNDDFGKESIEDMLNLLDTPFTYNENGEFYLPKSLNNPEEDSTDMILLIANSALYNFMVHPNIYRCCPLKFICMQAEPPIEKEECFDLPWFGKTCPITILGKYLGLPDKKFEWKE